MSKSKKRTTGGLNLRNRSDAVQDFTTPYQRPKLKITDVRTAELRAQGYQVHVRVYTDQGIFGHGEATDAAHGAVPLIKAFKHSLIGQDPLNIDFLFENLRVTGLFHGAQSGQYITALTGLEIALWDLAGKALGLPIYQLLGGKMRDRIRLYCDTATPIPGDPAAQQRLHKVKDLGFTALKIDVDEQHSPLNWDPIHTFDRLPVFAPVKVNLSASNAEIDYMIKKIASVREAFDPRVDLCVDMHGQYDVSTAKRLAREVEPLKLLYLEEPVPAENVQALRDIRESTITPIASGENLYLRHGFRELFEKQAGDIVQPDMQAIDKLIQQVFTDASTVNLTISATASQQVRAENAPILIENGTNVSGLAAKLATILKGEGFNVIGVQSAATNDLPGSQIEDFDPKATETVQALESMFQVPAENSTLAPPQGAAIVLIIGGSGAINAIQQAG